MTSSLHGSTLRPTAINCAAWERGDFEAWEAGVSDEMLDAIASRHTRAGARQYEGAA